MYKSISPNLNFVEEEKKVEKFWEDENIFEKSIAEREGDKPYVFYDGPPTANGKPHIGHVLTRVIKDMIPRYRTMKGYMVPRKAGWDMLGKTDKAFVGRQILILISAQPERVKIGRASCRERV